MTILDPPWVWSSRTNNPSPTLSRIHTDALEHYFWRYKNGTVMEIGAVDGTLLSQSLPFVENFGWRRILVEANPVLRDRLASLRGKVWAVNAAICENRTAVHYRALKVSHYYLFPNYPRQVLPHLLTFFFVAISHNPSSSVWRRKVFFNGGNHRIHVQQICA